MPAFLPLEVVGAWLVASPVIIVLLTLGMMGYRHRLHSLPEPVPFWGMRAGERYHVEIWPAAGNPFDFIDEFSRFNGNEAEFLTRTVHRSPTDQVRVTPIAPTKKKVRP